MKYCFQCMAKLDRDGGICPVCGYDNSVNTNGIGFLPPCTLNNQYIVGKALGRGGFGITYIGLDIYLDRKVAIKEYFPMSLAIRDQNTHVLYPVDPGAEDDFRRGIERVLKEARVAVSLESIPNVVHTFGVIAENNTVYIIMEYIEGLTLTKYVQKEGGKLSWLQAWPLLKPIMAALGKIHSRGVVHRDVSPDNIMIRRDGTPVLLDFGAAQNISSGNTSHSVSLRMGYAPLEQFSATGPRDGRSDQYSMMATLYYALTGKEPDSGMTLEEMAGPRAMGADIPESAEKVLMKGMSRRMEDRYPSMEALMEAFERASSNEYTRIVSGKMESCPTEISGPAGKIPTGSETGGAANSHMEVKQEKKQASASAKDVKKRRTGKMIPGLTLAVIIVVLLGAVIWGEYQKKAANARNYELYSNALEHISAGHYEEAVEILTSLGDFEDAVQQREIAESAIEERNNAEAYTEAQALEQAGRYDEAQKAYAALGTYRDSEEKAENLSREKRLEPYKTVGSIVTFGHYEQDGNTANGTEAIEWMVLDVQDGKALLVSRYGLEGKAYHNKRGAITWEECDLRKWLNSEFLKMAFTEEEQSTILTSMVANGVEQGYWKTNGGNDTQDQVFLLSYAEANRYLGVNGNANAQAQCVATRYAQNQGAYTDVDSKCRWWLRSPGSRLNYAACVLDVGSRSGSSVDSTGAVVRPAFWLNLESDIF